MGAGGGEARGDGRGMDVLMWMARAPALDADGLLFERTACLGK